MPYQLPAHPHGPEGATLLIQHWSQDQNPCSGTEYYYELKDTFIIQSMTHLLIT
jgi:hypothetical protein